MLCSKFKQIPINSAVNNVTIRPIILTRHYSKKRSNFLAFARFQGAFENMSSTLRLRNILKELVVTRLFSVWTRSYMVSSVVKRCRKDRAVRDAIQCFRQTILKPKRTLLFTVTAAYKSHDEKPGSTSSCSKTITDEELQELVNEFQGVEELAQATLYCTGCAKRIIIDNKHPNVRYCACKDAEPPSPSHEGWEPYMEAEDVIIWRKEYITGKGLYAYKVYGRYKEIDAQDFAAIQVDGAYRRFWDTAVASLSIVERQANGVSDQTILHWEVLWPRLFANRDYVYIRRHKEFNIKSHCQAHKEGIFNPEPCHDGPIQIIERPNVHSNAKRKAIEQDKKVSEEKGSLEDNKAYIIVSKSCIHPQVPETRNAIRVKEYWSHMIVKTLNGPGKPGMEFVLTYYDEPTVGGMPSSVTSWATGRAAPAFLDRMRKAATDYNKWRARNDQQVPDFTPFGPEKVSYEEDNKAIFRYNEQDMESSKLGPDLGPDTREQSTQTESHAARPSVEPAPLDIQIVYPRQDRGTGTDEAERTVAVVSEEEATQPSPAIPIAQATMETVISETPPKNVYKPEEIKTDTQSEQSDYHSVKQSANQTDKSEDISQVRSEDPSEDDTLLKEQETSRGWWRYLHPYYYFY